MNERLYPACEYCYLDKVVITKNCKTTDDDGNECYKIKVMCYFDLRDVNKIPLPDKPKAVKTEYIYPTKEMITDMDLWKIWPSVIKPVVDKIIAEAKKEYANFIIEKTTKYNLFAK